ncbi:sporulation integral membrane protein YtvI [Bacillus massilinigeriensis]|uniref:sporulation integral membrane protein YtvI n=1 Tax=Bacillus mediterraneensis TaxID=1805474 RepID=UPI0008F861A7|nr:sporulation integral membrane protein YtvI [Bacillus mediterraneensis]
MWKKWIWTTVLVALVIFLIPYSLPLLFALLTAAMLEGMIQKLITKMRFNRLQAVLTVFTGYVLLIGMVGYNLISITAQQAVSLSQRTPTFVKDFYRSVILPLVGKWEFYSQKLPTDVFLSIEGTIESNVNALDAFLQRVVESLLNFLTSIPVFLIEVLIYLIALFLISLEWPQLKAKLETHLKEQTKNKLYLVTRQLSKAGLGFIKAQVILSAITYIMAFTGLSILKAPYVGLLSILIVIVDILPILGTGSVLVPWAVVAILQNNHFLGIGLIILFVVITVVRRVIEPKIYSTNLGISPLASLISMYIGFKLLGIAGVLIGPTIIIVYDTLRKANIINIKFKI